MATKIQPGYEFGTTTPPSTPRQVVINDDTSKATIAVPPTIATTPTPVQPDSPEFVGGGIMPPNTPDHQDSPHHGLGGAKFLLPTTTINDDEEDLVTTAEGKRVPRSMRDGGHLSPGVIRTDPRMDPGDNRSK